MSQKGNILLVANWDSNVGYAWWLMESYWVTIADNFSKEERQSFLVYPKITVIPDAIKKSNITPIELDFHNHSFVSLNRLRSTIKLYGIKHIYLSDSPAYSLMYVMLRFWGIKTIIIHDHTPGERDIPGAIKKSLKSFVQRLPYITADHFIAATEFVRARLVDVLCIPNSKCSCAPNGIIPIDLSHYDKQYAQKTFNISLDRKIVITTGRATFYKGIDFFIECAHELINCQGINQLHFLYCGEGPDMDDFKSLVKNYQLANNFTFAGNRADIRDILPSCHIGFHASTGEVGYSLSILEYMSAGLVTIVPEGPSTSLATTNMENGILYKYRDLDSATKSIKDAFNNNYPSILRYNAVNLIEEKLCLENTNRKLIEIMNMIID